MREDRIRLYQTLPHPCGYWRERTATNVVIDPQRPDLDALYPDALAHGFRRAGGHLYRPGCEHCQACIACRIPVDPFHPNRSQQRCLRRNADLVCHDLTPGYTPERYALYQRYLHTQHRDGGMDGGTIKDFREFLCASWGTTRFLEWRDGSCLLAVAAIDITADALSAVYTWYEPEQIRRGLGTFAILQQIAYAKRHELNWVYLGFWIENHPKMDYKRRFHPLETLGIEGWRELG